MNQVLAGSTILLSAISPSLRVWLITLSVALFLFVFFLLQREFRTQQPILWRIIIGTIIATIIPVPISMNNGHSAEWTMLFPIGVLIIFNVVGGLIVLAIASLLIFAIWSATAFFLKIK